MSIRPKTRVQAGCIAALLIVVPFQPAAAAVFGEDDRRKLTTDHPLYPIREALGQITCRHPETGKKLFGTAAIIDTGLAPNGQETLITAAHVVMDPASGQALDRCRFKQHGRRWGSDPVVGVRHGSFTGTPQTNPEDWALVIIDPAKPADLRLRVWPAASAASDEVALLAYRGDREGLWVSGNCFARPPRRSEALYTRGVWLSDCDATPGSSGAPLMVRDGDGWFWGGLYRGHLFEAARHEEIPDWQATFSGQKRMNVIVRIPLESTAERSASRRAGP